MAMVGQAPARDKAQQQEMQARATSLGTGTTVSKEPAEALGQMAVSETQEVEHTQAQMAAQEKQPAEQEQAQHQAQQQGTQAQATGLGAGNDVGTADNEDAADKDEDTADNDGTEERPTEMLRSW